MVVSAEEVLTASVPRLPEGWAVLFRMEPVKLWFPTDARTRPSFCCGSLVCGGVVPLTGCSGTGLALLSVLPSVSLPELCCLCALCFGWLSRGCLFCLTEPFPAASSVWLSEKKTRRAFRCSVKPCRTRQSGTKAE